jgi:hypothetical protein
MYSDSQRGEVRPARSALQGKATGWVLPGSLSPRTWRGAGLVHGMQQRHRERHDGKGCRPILSTLETGPIVHSGAYRRLFKP